MVLAAMLAGPSHADSGTADPTRPAPTPVTGCDAGSNPETGVDGDIPTSDINDGRWQKDYYCNARLVSQIGSGGGYRVERYVDHSGHVCAYFDSGTLFPNSAHPDGSGVWVLDMTDPKRPVHTASLATPAMLTPHESLRLNQQRGLLVADQGNPATEPGLLDVYDVSQDCRQPKLDAEIPDGLGHESGFAPDGRTFYVSSNNGFMAAVDLTNPAFPQIIWTSSTWHPHGLSLSDDGNTMFIADTGNSPGMTILDVSQIQQRMPSPQVTQLSHLTWPEVSIPQNATPFTSHGHRYVVETDEFGGGNGPVGAGRIISVDDLHHPYVVSRLRLAVFNQNDANKTAHYCTVPSRIDPYIIACGMLASGLRVFDIRDVAHPVEIAYANFTSYQTIFYNDSNGLLDTQQLGHVYSAPAYDPVHNDIWYSDGTRGFFAVHLTAASGVKQFARAYWQPGS
jgi:hypothetical protein